MARQFVDRLARQRGIELPKGDIFSDAAARAVKKGAGPAGKKGAAPAEPPSRPRRPAAAASDQDPPAAGASRGAGRGAAGSRWRRPVDGTAKRCREPGRTGRGASATACRSRPPEPVVVAEAPAAPAVVEPPGPTSADRSKCPSRLLPRRRNRLRWPRKPAAAAGRFVPPSIRLRVEEPGQAPPKAPPLQPRRPMPPPQPRVDRRRRRSRRRPQRPATARSARRPAVSTRVGGRPAAGVTPAMMGGPRPLPVAAGSPDEPAAAPGRLSASGRGCRQRPGGQMQRPAGISSCAHPVRVRVVGPRRDCAARRMAPRADRAAAGLAHDHAGRRHDRQGSRRQARYAREGRAQGAARSPVDDDDQLDDRHRHGARDRAAVRRRHPDAQLRRGADRGRVRNRRASRIWCRARRS